jgi:glycosyltransferase involved in cell wall biosynthesis
MADWQKDFSIGPASGRSSHSMSRKPTLALCIPAYKAEAYLPRILSSAKKQLIPFDEIVVYDDASPDGTSRVAEALGARVIRGETNQGCTWARKMMAESVQSDWIHFHDADDDMTERFTTLAHAWMRRTDAPDVVLFNYDWIDLATGKLLGKTRFDKEKAEKDPVLFTLETQVNPFCGLYRKKSFLKAGGPDTDPAVRQCEDMAMHCKLARAGLRFSVESETSIVNYAVAGSMSRSKSSYKKAIPAVYFLYKKSFDWVVTHPYSEDRKKAIGLKMWQHTRHAAWMSSWDMVKKSIELARSCGVSGPFLDSKSFQMICRLSPFHAVMLREYLARIHRKPDSYWY